MTITILLVGLNAFTVACINGDSIPRVQEVFVFDTIVQVPLHYDQEIGTKRSVGGGVCLFIYAISDTPDGTTIGFARVSLDSFKLDTLHYDNEAHVTDTSIQRVQRGGFQSLSHHHNIVSVLYDSSIVISRIQGDTIRSFAEYLIPVGYGRHDWLNDRSIILHPAGYMGPSWPHRHSEIQMLDVATGTLTTVHLPDDESAIFHLFEPDRFLAVCDGVLWYLRPTDGALFRHVNDSTWTLFSEGRLQPVQAIRDLARNSERTETRSLNRHRLIDSIEVLLEKSRSGYAAYLMFDPACKCAYICDYRYNHANEDNRVSYVSVVSVAGNSQGTMIGMFSDSSVGMNVQCSRATYPVQIALNQCVIVGEYLYSLGDRAEMGVAYDERLTLKELRDAELRDKLHNEAKFAITRYRYKHPCGE